MKMNCPAAATLTALGAMLTISHAFAAGESQAALKAEARVDQAQATATALARVPHGVVKSVELEREHGKLIWSFDLGQPSAKGVTEVQVDAMTGKIASLKKETSAQEAREMRAEAKDASAAK
jgi:uncharacterized membrane protein YkoI